MKRLKVLFVAVMMLAMMSVAAGPASAQGGGLFGALGGFYGNMLGSFGSTLTSPFGSTTYGGAGIACSFFGVKC